MNAADAVKRAALVKVVDYLLKDPENNMPRVMDKLDALLPDSLFASQRNSFKRAIDEQDNWYQLLLRVAHLNPEVCGPLVKNFLIESNILAWSEQERQRDKNGCNIPWAILLDPTSACNLRCTGCWAAEYGHSLNLSCEDIDSIINQGKELGVRVYILEHYRNQPFNDNLLRPCPMLENPDCLERMVEDSGAHSTDLTQQEDVHDLCGKCRSTAEEWAPVAERIWEDESEPTYQKRHTSDQGMAASDLHRFEAVGRKR